MPKRTYRIIGLGCLFLGGWRFLHFMVQDIALGYDPGLYKILFESMMSLEYRDFTQLAPWLQSMYPPMLGMQSVIVQMLGVSSDRLVTRGIAIQALLVPVTVYVFVKPLDRRAAIIAAGLARISFVQYEVFRRNYMKQLMGMFFLLMTLSAWMRKKRVLSISFLVTLALVHRPGIAVLALIAIVWGVFQLRYVYKAKKESIALDRKVSDRYGYIGGSLIAAILAYIVYEPYIQEQVMNMISPVLSTIDVPNFDDGFQSGGTFLTTAEFLNVNRHILISGVSFGLLGCFRRKKSVDLLLIGLGVTLLRVFGQGFFYQRMMGYLDLFLLMMTGRGLVRMYDRKKRPAFVLGVILLIVHIAIFITWVGRTRRPLIMEQELELIQDIPTLTDSDAIIVVPGIAYSPWVQGRSQRDVIAPGLFDLNEWGVYRPGREEKWIDATASQKCLSLRETYGGLERPLYVYQGSKQIRWDLSGACFELVQGEERPFRQLWKVDFE